ncbi:MAG: response regulator [Verrucomicrobiales bacterium]|nr:response regulator [Verrucomicrobiales bacterium]
MSTKILFVDDDANILAAFQRNLRKQFPVDIAVGGEQGLSVIGAQGPYAVVVADMQMPRMNGLEFLKKLEEVSPDTVRIMLTGNADQKTAADAVNQGHVFRFLTKPCSTEDLAFTLTAALKQYSLVIAERELLEKTLSGSVKLLTEILSMTDPQSFGQAQTLRDYTRTYVKSMSLAASWEFELAALLSPIGMVTVPPPVAYKARTGTPLTGAEKDILARMPETGANLLANIPRLEKIAQIVRYHKKQYDGGGFPADRLAGDDLPVAARILKVLSDLLELENKGVPLAKALEEMQRRTGWYDPRVLDACFVCFDVYLPRATQPSGSRLAISAKELRVNDILASDVATKEGLLVVTAGTQISQMVLLKLRNFAELGDIKEPIYVQPR